MLLSHLLLGSLAWSPYFTFYVPLVVYLWLTFFVPVVISPSPRLPAREPLFYIPPWVVYLWLTLFAPVIISPSLQLPWPGAPLLHSTIGGLSLINPFYCCYYLAFSSPPLPTSPSFTLYYWCSLIYLFLLLYHLLLSSPAHESLFYLQHLGLQPPGNVPLQHDVSNGLYNNWKGLNLYFDQVFSSIIQPYIRMFPVHILCNPVLSLCFSVG